MALAICIIISSKYLDIEQLLELFSSKMSLIFLFLLCYIVWWFFEILSINNLLSSHLGFFKIWKIYVVGETYNKFTPFLGFGGDPIRIVLLKKEIGLKTASRAIFVFKYLDMIAAILIGLFFLTIAYFHSELKDSSIKEILFIAILIYCTLFIFLWIGLIKSLPELCSGLILKLLKINGNLDDFDFRTLINSLFLQLGSRLNTILEILLILFILEIQLNFLLVVIIIAFSSLSTVIFFFIPNGIGSNEFFLAKSTDVIGMSPEIGLTVAVFRRFRDLFFGTIGFIVHVTMTSEEIKNHTK